MKSLLIESIGYNLVEYGNYQDSEQSKLEYIDKIFSFKVSKLYPAQKNAVYRYFLNPLIEQLLINLTRIKPKP